MKRALVLVYFTLCAISCKCLAQCNFYIKFYNYTNADNVLNLLQGPGNTFFAVIDYHDASDPYVNKAIAQLDSSGDTLLVKSWCGGIIKDLQYTMDSNLIGLSLTSSVCGDSTIGMNGLKVTKFDQNGDTIWNSIFGAPGINWAEGLAVLRDSTYIVISDNSGYENVTHIDNSGNFLNNMILPFYYLKDVTQGKDGNIYYCGYAGAGFTDSFVIGKSNEALDTIYWINSFGTTGGNYGDWFNALSVLPDSNIVVTGRDGTYKINYLTGDSIWKNNVRGDAIWPMKDSTLIVERGTLNKMTYNGDSIWAKNLNISVSKGLVLNSIVELDGGCIAALGSRVTIASPQNIYEPFFAYFDSLFDFPVNAGLDNLVPANVDVTVVPNPFDDHLTIHSNNNSAIKNISLLNVTGTVLQTFEVNAKRPEVLITNLGTFVSGVYLIRIQTETGVSYCKIIKL